MLFNTLAYGKFFIFVFLLAWLLARRRFAPLFPWCAVMAFAVLGPRLASSLVIVPVAFVLSMLLCRLTDDDQVPPLKVALASVIVNGIALCFLTWTAYRMDPLSLGLKTLGVDLTKTTAWEFFFQRHAWAPSITAALIGAGLCTILVRARKLRLLFILGASYVFYAHWDWRFLPLIWGSSTIDWLLGHAIFRAKSSASRRLWLIGTVILNLGILAIFKYFNFGVDTAVSALHSLGVEVPRRTLNVALPIGISFFTFESMSYVIDIYRGHIKPQKSYFEYLSFVAFFPHLVAGPIVRPRDLLPQLAGPPRFSARDGSEALFLIAVGLLKKIAIGDYLAINLVDRVFDAPFQYSALENYSAVLGYAVQIYCDFSGYTDVAIGSALLLGVRFPLNFNAPYKATNIQDFWRRWHISLSTWLRDYLYVPLGGNRKSRGRTYVNLMLTMLLGGLWHGANWTFVVWGGIHGAALAVTRAVNQRWGKALATQNPLSRALAVLFTFHLVCAAWIFFRAESFQKAAQVYSQLATFTTYHPNLHPMVLGVLAVGLLSHWIPEKWYEGVRRVFIEMPAPAQAAELFCVCLLLKQMATADAVPFVYFQF